jgi:hypothetical protein
MTCDDGGTYTCTETGTITGGNEAAVRLTGGEAACVISGHAIASGQLRVAGGTGRFTTATGRWPSTWTTTWPPTPRPSN